MPQADDSKRYRRQQGFTLIELMMVLVIAAVILTVGIPSMRQTIVNTRMTGHLNDFVVGLQTARTEAVKNNADVTLCRSADGTDCDGASWADGWIVWFDEDGDASVDLTEILASGEGNDDLTFKNAWFGADIVYRADATANQNGAVKFCYGAEVAGQVRLDVTGRPSAMRLTHVTGCP